MKDGGALKILNFETFNITKSNFLSNKVTNF